MKRIALLISLVAHPMAMANRVDKHTYSTGIQVNALGWNFNHDFYALPREGDVWGGSRGEIKGAPWRGDYWQTSEWEIARRLNVTKATMPTQEELAKYSEQQLRNLSPAEKYDIVRNDFNYTLTKSVLVKFDKTLEKYGQVSKIPTWEGICHGWANAALHFPTEPKPLRYKGKFSKEIPFGSHDVKALLSWFQGEWGNTVGDKDRLDTRRSIGKTCPYKKTDPNFFGNFDCQDIKPQVFHLLLANKIGLRKQGFVADLFYDDEVWNFPVFKYETTILKHENAIDLKKDFHSETVKAIKVRTKVYYATEISPNWEALGTRYTGNIKTKFYTYTLALDARGNIVDGKWDRFSEQPDTLWVYEKFNFINPKSPDKEILSSELQKIYQQSIEQ